VQPVREGILVAILTWIALVPGRRSRPLVLLGVGVMLLLGADPHARGWGPLQQGQGLGADLAHSRKTKSTKVVAVDARRTPMAAAADLHLPILPGTELFFVLGMIRAILDNKWQDAQFIRDYTRDIDALEAALAPWPLAR
jgi:anaerobic selenocysteine-containing dehydrogenase